MPDAISVSIWEICFSTSISIAVKAAAKSTPDDLMLAFAARMAVRNSSVMVSDICSPLPFIVSGPGNVL